MENFIQLFREVLICPKLVVVGSFQYITSFSMDNFKS